MSRNRTKHTPGYVYIFSVYDKYYKKNKNLFKVGCTEKSPEIRAEQFSKRSQSFKVKWKKKVPDMYLAENLLQSKYNEYYFEDELFHIPPNKTLKDVIQDAKKYIEYVFSFDNRQEQKNNQKIVYISDVKSRKISNIILGLKNHLHYKELEEELEKEGVSLFSLMLEHMKADDKQQKEDMRKKELKEKAEYMLKLMQAEEEELNEREKEAEKEAEEMLKLMQNKKKRKSKEKNDD